MFNERNTFGVARRTTIRCVIFDLGGAISVERRHGRKRVRSITGEFGYDGIDQVCSEIVVGLTSMVPIRSVKSTSESGQSKSIRCGIRTPLGSRW